MNNYYQVIEEPKIIDILKEISEGTLGEGTSFDYDGHRWVYDKEDEWINTITSGEKKDERNQSTHYRYRGNDYISKMYIECRDSMNHLKILKEIPSLLNVLTLLSNKLKDRLKIFQKTNMYPTPPMCS